MSYFKNIKQDVVVAAGNSSSTNLAAGATWAGTPVSTLGVVGLQWNLNTDQNCTIYSEESEGSHTGLGTVATNGTTTLTGTDTVFERSFVVGDTISVAGETDRIIATIASNTSLTVTSAFSTTDSGLAYTHYHWDISYPFDFIFKSGDKGEGETVQATNAYWRLRVVNEGTATTTFFRVSGVLCPIATPLPSSLSTDARLKTEVHISDQLDRHININPTNEMPISPVPRLVGTAFIGTTLDPNFWIGTDVAANGTVAQTGGIVSLDTTADSGSYAKLTSKRSGRFVAGSALIFSGGFNFKTAGTAGNLRRAGVYTLTDGFFFQLNGTTFSIGSRIGSADTLVNSGSFNGVLGLSWTPTAGTYYKLTIEYTPLTAFWFINGKLLHKASGAGQSATMTLPIQLENTNTGVVDIIEFDCVGAYIAREGELVTNATSGFAAAGQTTTVYKYGAGILRGIVISAITSGAIVDIYDGLTTGGTLIWSSGALPAKQEPVPIPFYETPFSDGLTIDTNTQNSAVFVSYE